MTKPPPLGLREGSVGWRRLGSNCWGVTVGVISLEHVENVLKLDCGNGYTTVNIQNNYTLEMNEWYGFQIILW